MNCKLCNENNANQTGSHLVPSFLLKRVFNDGEKGRDKGLIFNIGTYETESTFERGVSQERLEKAFGELTDEEITTAQEDMQEFISDNIFCTDCEDRFSTIENEYAKTLEYFKEEEYSNIVPPEIAFLFWTSIIWRISIEKAGNFKVSEKEENRLKRILNKHLKKELENMDINAIKNDTDCKGLSYRLLRCPNYHQYKGSACVLSPYSRQPYYLMIDEFVLGFYFKASHIEGMVNSFFGFESYLKDVPLNSVGKGEYILPIVKEEYEKCNLNVQEHLAQQRTKAYSGILNAFAKKIWGMKQMPFPLKKEIFEALANSDIELGRKYTLPHLYETTVSVLGKYGLMNG